MGRTDDLLNSWIIFYSPKFVRVFNYRLGLLRLLFIVGVLLYAIIYTMLYSGDHLLRVRITGTATLNTFPPREIFCHILDQNCDKLRSREELPYCENSILVGPEKRPCTYLDGYEVNKVDMGLGNVFVPLRIMEYQATRVDDGSGNRKRVRRMNMLASLSTLPKQEKDFYVADIDRYHVHIMHSAIGATGMLSWDHTHMEGYYTGLDGAVRPMSCLGDIPLPGCGSSKSWSEWWSGNPELNAEQNVPQISAEPLTPKRRPHWDTLSVRTLVRLSNESLDTPTEELPNNAITKRSCGLILWINIYYTNKEKWAGLKITPWSSVTPRYTYTIRKTKVSSCPKKRVTVSSEEWKVKHGSTRTVAKVYGIKIMSKPGGEILVWDTMQTLIVLSASMGLITFACLVLDYLLEYLTHWFEVIKYETHEEEHLREQFSAPLTSSASSTLGP